MGNFADALHELCQREMNRALGCRDASAEMTVELLHQLANTIAIATDGESANFRAATAQAMKALPVLVFEKSAIVRRELAKNQNEETRT